MMNRQKLFFILICAATSLSAAACSDSSMASSEALQSCDSEGAAKCDAAGKRLVCTDGFFTPDPCGENEKCLNGECRIMCDIETFVKSCDGNDRIYCEWNHLISRKACPEGQYCEDGSCKPGVNPDVGHPCDSSFKATCQNRTTTITCEDEQIKFTSCPNGTICQKGACIEDPDKPQNIPCDTNNYQASCKDTSSRTVCVDNLEQYIPCAETETCSEGVCTDTCDINFKSCTANGKRQYCENGQIKAAECPEQQICAKGECHDTCRQDYTGCTADGKTRLFCDNGIIASETCPNGMICDAGQCTEPKSDSECDPDTFNEGCNPKGETIRCIDGKISIEACPDGEICYLGKCEKDLPCASSSFTPYCADENTQKLCRNSMETNVPCPEGEKCENGICQNPAASHKCTDQDSGCETPHIAIQCIDGAIHKSYCDVEKQICSAGKCIDKNTAETCLRETFVPQCLDDSKIICEHGYIAKYSCGEGRHCEDGICYDNIQINDLCDPRTFIPQCLDDGKLAVCSNGIVTPRDCMEKACYDGACVGCTEDNFIAACDGNDAVKICRNGEITSQKCNAGDYCQNGKCAPTPDIGASCNSVTHKPACNADGKLVECIDDKIVISTCSGDTPICFDGMCAACNPYDGTKHCKVHDGKASIFTCSTTGVLNQTKCGTDETCHMDHCAQCNPNEFQTTCLDDRQEQYCDENGMIKTKNCSNGEYCLNGHCTSGCKTDSDCQQHYVCTQNQCVFQPECTDIGHTECIPNGNAFRQCIAPGLWETTSCAQDQICSNGKCMGTQCTGSASTYCDGNTPAKCENGYFKPIAEECTGKNAVCVNGTCMPCKHGVSHNICIGNIFRHCQDNNTYQQTQCGNNEKCDIDKGCISKCGENFTEHCSPDGKRVYCNNGVITEESCSFQEQCENGSCISKVGKSCDYYTFPSRCIEDNLHNSILEFCDPDDNGIQYSMCNSNQFCGTIDGITDCFIKCNTPGTSTCINSGVPNSNASIGTCKKGKDAKGSDTTGYYKDPAVCSNNGYSNSCYIDSTGLITFNHYYCPVLNGGTCNQATGTCSNFVTGSCSGLSGQCSNGHAINCVRDPGNVTPANPLGYVQTDTDCSALNAPCVSYMINGHTQANCRITALFKLGNNTNTEISSTGTCIDNTLWTLTPIAEDSSRAWGNDCQEKTCTTETNNGVTFSYCK